MMLPGASRIVFEAAPMAASLDFAQAWVLALGVRTLIEVQGESALGAGAR